MKGDFIRNERRGPASVDAKPSPSYLEATMYA